LAELKEKTGDYREAIRLYKLILADNELHVLSSITNCYHYLKGYRVCVWCCTRAIQLNPSKEAWWNNLVYSLMAQDKGLCAITVEKLRMDLMQALSFNEEPSPSPSEFALILLQTIEVEFGKSFVDSILTPSPPF
jgi:tetratricopeptide (TPR) repeat protein